MKFCPTCKKSVEEMEYLSGYEDCWYVDYDCRTSYDPFDDRLLDVETPEEAAERLEVEKERADHEAKKEWTRINDPVAYQLHYAPVDNMSDLSNRLSQIFFGPIKSVDRKSSILGLVHKTGGFDDDDEEDKQ